MSHIVAFFAGSALGCAVGILLVSGIHSDRARYTKGPSLSPQPLTPASNPDRAYKHYDTPREMVDVRFSTPARLIRVPSSYPSIQKAMDAATNGDCIIVAPGHYVGDIALRDGVYCSS